jgi:uncharacterized repeat protein (TIGR03803 family)
MQMQKRNYPGRLGMLSALYIASVTATPAQTFTVLRRFNGSNGSTPVAPLVQGTDGKLYGTTYSGGASGDGTVFKITSAGALKTLHSFCTSGGCPDGQGVQGGLILGWDAFFHGTTLFGGAHANGTAFQIKPGGRLTTQYSFCAAANCSDGGEPFTSLLQGRDGFYYGTTMGGGNGNSGTVFQFPDIRGSILATLHSFCALANCADGASPEAALVQGTDGNFYGTTNSSGANQGGTVFQITPGGSLTTLYSFCSAAHCPDGMAPFAALVQASDGNFYGTTNLGGTSTNCSVGCGTVFKITSAGALTTLHSFALSDGAFPLGLVLGTDGNFYGATEGGGPVNKGTIFQITPGGVLTNLHTFAGSDGSEPFSALTQATDGNFYGTASGGGRRDNGTDFRLSMGLGPFVQLVPPTHQVGEAISILGNNLTGATSVTFNGLPSKFAVVSPTLIYAGIPSGGASGLVQVVTPNGTLTSNVAFQVVP